VKPRQFFSGTSYDPDRLKALYKAFDDAWARVAPDVSARPKAIEAARLKLAEIIFGLARNGDVEPKQLADAAVQLMLTGPLRVRRSARSRN
jgi:hypothetical protein